MRPPDQCRCTGRCPADTAPPAGTAQNPDKPDAATAPASPATSSTGSVAGHDMIPDAPAQSASPTGRKGIQEQVTPIGQEAAAFHNNWLLLLCAVISVFVLALLLYAMVRFRRGANPMPSRNSHNTLIEVIWTLVPVLILVAIAIPSIRLLRHQYTPPPGRPDGQGHRPPMVLVLRASRQWRDASTATC